MQFSGAGSHMKGRVRWAVFNADGSIDNGGTLQPDMPSNNLILDQGIDQLDTNLLCALFENCAVGTGTSTPAATQVELDNEKGRTNNYVSSLCGTTFPADGSSPYTITMKRGFDFPQGSLDSSTDGDYTEIGFSHSSSAGQNLFSRALIKDENDNTISVTVSSDQILRIAYELDVTLEPSSKTSDTFDITNIGTIGYEALGATIEGGYRGVLAVSLVNDDGTTDDQSPGGQSQGFALDPYGLRNRTGTDSAVLVITADDTTFHSGWTNGSVTLPSFGASSNTRTVTYQGNGVWQYDVTFATDQGNLSNIKNMMLGYNTTKDKTAIRFRVNDGDEFTKENTHELVLTFEISYTAN